MRNIKSIKLFFMALGIAMLIGGFDALAQFTPFPAATPPQTINSLTEKVAPVGNDEVQISDSEDSNSSKKVKISNLVPSSGSNYVLGTPYTGNAYSVNTNSYITAPNSSVTITASGTKPIEYKVMGYGLCFGFPCATTGGAYVPVIQTLGTQCNFTLFRDGTAIENLTFQYTSGQLVAPPLHFVDWSPPAGAHTYELKGSRIAGSGQCFMNLYRVFAKEF